jgi:hypothetical protein
LQKQIVVLWKALMAMFWIAEEPEEDAGDQEFFRLVEEARIEWQSAVSRFNEVTEADLIDHAIHSMQAAERKYTYLLKKARREGYRLPVSLDALRERGLSRADL